MNHKVHKSLKQVEDERAAEKADAARFITKEGVGNLPGKRSETGESAGRQTVGHSSNPTQADGAEAGGLPRKHRDDLSYDAYRRLTEDGEPSLGGAEAFEEDHPEARFLMVGVAIGGLDYDEMEKRARMNHVYSFLREPQVDILRKWGIEGMTLEAIAEEEGVSKQAVHKRLTKAKAAFVLAYEAHWNDFPVEVE